MTPVEFNRVVRWHVRQLVSTNRVVRFDVRSLVSISRQVRYTVNSIFVTVLFDRTLRWNVWQLLTLLRRIHWQVSAAPTAPLVVSQPPVFDRVHVDFMNIGETRVTWSLSPRFRGNPPYTFQLQVGQTGNPLADDWQDVGSPVVDAFMATDVSRRWFGKVQTPHYRVVLRTATNEVYVSPPATVLGDLNWREWRLAQEIIRKEKLRHRWFASVPGFLLKQRRDGARCSRCIDRLTGEPKDSRCPLCYGTGWLGGYFKPLPLTYADVDLGQIKEQRQLQAAGMTAPVVVTARFIGAPQLYAQDVWVNSKSDARYIIHTVKPTAHIHGVPLVLMAELRLLPPDDVVYSIPVPNE